MEMPRSKYEANKRYDKVHYERVSLDVRKGNREKLKKYCAIKKVSVNGFLKEAVNEKLERDGADFRIE